MLDPSLYLGETLTAAAAIGAGLAFSALYREPGETEKLAASLTAIVVGIWLGDGSML